MVNKMIQSSMLILILLGAGLLGACGSGPDSNSEPQGGGQDEGLPSGAGTWDYKMTVVTNYGKSDALQEHGTVVFDGSFSVTPEGGILFDKGTTTVSGEYRCRDRNSDTDPPTILEGTLSGASTFTIAGSLIAHENYRDFGMEIPLEPLVDDELQTEYALLSLPKVTDRSPVAVSFGREKCTGSMVPVIAEVVSFGEIPFFEGEFIPTFVVALDPRAAFVAPIGLNDEGSKLLASAEICVAPSGLCR